ncbi:MAG: nuclear transport factor 2 family protein [Planctomycetota bacterium]|nr:nuclear transport factor 2 family protein [Planctomycetota bacterium]
MLRSFCLLGLIGGGLLAGLLGPRLHAEEAPPRAAIDAVLEAFHAAAAAADGAAYFDQMTPDAVFLGTDATERWPREDFEAFARPYFAKGKGWRYTRTSRHVQVEADGRMAWFDELLHNESYGTCRGSGVLRHADGRWRIAQYNLSIPIPNPLARDVVASIRARDGLAQSTSVVYIVRHAEKGSGHDPALTPAGHARAQHLCRVLRSAGIERVYDTQYKRTQQTVAPTATHLGVPVTRVGALETKALAARLRADTQAKAVLVAAHGNTVPALLEHLGVRATVSIGHAEFDNLFVVRLRGTAAPRFQHLHYGE